MLLEAPLGDRGEILTLTGVGFALIIHLFGLIFLLLPAPCGLKNRQAQDKNRNEHQGYQGIGTVGRYGTKYQCCMGKSIIVKRLSTVFYC